MNSYTGIDGVVGDSMGTRMPWHLGIDRVSLAAALGASTLQKETKEKAIEHNIKRERSMVSIEGTKPGPFISKQPIAHFGSYLLQFRKI